MAEGAAQFFRLESEAGISPFEGVTMRAILGRGGMINLLDLDPDAVVPRHSHPHEQLGIVLRGVQILEVEGVEHHLQPLDGYVVPGGVEHSGRGGPDGCLVIDVFVPAREDYRHAAATPIDG